MAEEGIILNKNIEIVEETRKEHSKASEEYLHVKFFYSDATWDGWVPVEYRRTGVSIKPEETDKLAAYLNTVYEQMNPAHFQRWKEKQDKFWKEEKSHDNEGFFRQPHQRRVAMRRMHVAQESELGAKNTRFKRIRIYHCYGYQALLSHLRTKQNAFAPASDRKRRRRGQRL